MIGSHLAPPVAGLTEAEAAARRAAGQGNTKPPPTSRTYWQIISENVFTFINICLFLLGFALILLHRPLDALISTGVISLNVLVSVVQEIRAKRTLDRIALLTRPTATVVRDGVPRAIMPEAVVVGDVIQANPGDQIIVDGRVLTGSMALDESQLTGESGLVPKVGGAPVFSGSFCGAGSGYYIAEQVGARSLAHRMTTDARAFRRVLTPLQREIHLVIRIALLLVTYGEFLLVLHALLARIDLTLSVQNSVIVASLVPNGLFLSISVAYALGAVRIAHFGALVQQANAIESLSHVDVLCLDKTGTLTTNRLVVHSLEPLAIPEEELKRTLGVMVASTSSRNKTADAIAIAYPEKPHPVVAEVLFSSSQKWSAVAFEDMVDTTSQPLNGIYALGAPEALRPFLDSDAGDKAASWPAIETRLTALTAQGLRVLLVAHTAESFGLEDYGDAARLPSTMRPLGLLSLHDELRPEAGNALAAFLQIGVRPKIISGDHPETVAALVRQAGLALDTRVVSGMDLEQMDEEAFAEAAASATVFGRISPQQKARLVDALRQRGRYVAMIGDGVNDVLSLKRAHVGIAMQSGSAATRGVADLVLLSDSFAPLAPAMVEGQRILNGMQTILKLFLTRITTIGLVVFSSLIIGEFPLALRNGSVVTLFSVGIPTILLAIWAKPGQVSKRRLVPQLFHFVLTPVVVTTVLALLVFYGTLLLGLQRAGALAPHVAPLHALAIASAVRRVAQSTLTIFLVFTGLFLVIFAAPPSAWWTGGARHNGDRRPTWLALGLMVAFVILNLVPPLRGLFALAPVGILEVGIVTLALIVWLVAVRWLWRHQLLMRFLGQQPGGPAEATWNP
jgi:cation-transporting ATPase E